ncbi:sensor histidine kinase, partial [Micromonospora sp. WMMD736]|uniref:sensor histidine kinase n=1 Tax=Micromonospora sp. WMMD736 TaxID=3404112 RepID=UPI003B954ED6
EPEYVSAILRLPLIGLMVMLVTVWEVDNWLPGVYVAVLGGYAVAAVLWLVLVLRGPVPSWASWVSTAADVLVISVLCVVSGGATAALLPVFFLLPLAVAFKGRPVVTAVLSVSAALGYLVVWIVYSKRDDTVGLPNWVYLHVGFLLWLAVATTALSFVLARRAARVTALLDLRRTLLAESMHAGERRNREVAELLHDGPLQTLLAARLDLDEARERVSDPALDAVDAALRQSTAGLRSTLGALHPHLLAQLGLAPALGELVRRYETRGDFRIEADIDDVGRSDSQALLYRAAAELLENVAQHAHASVVQVGLRRVGDRVVLSVADDGRGFEPAIVERCVAHGHIGLASLLVGVEVAGGSMDVQSAVGSGTRATVTSPPEPVTAVSTGAR